MTPGDATMRAAAGYEQGDNDVSALIDAADRETSGIVSGRLADGSLDDHATDHASSVFARTVLLAERRWNPSGDLAELVAIHRGLFDGVFSDAGRLRTSNVTREVTDKRHQAKNPEAFFPAQLIETGALNISTELADKRNLDNLDRGVFVRELAHVYDELGYLHPFKGGNAMTLRIFASRLAHDAGWDLDWGGVTRESYKQAKHAAYRGDINAFSQMFADIVRPAGLPDRRLGAGARSLTEAAATLLPVTTGYRSPRAALPLLQVAQMMLRILVRLLIDRVVIARVGMVDNGHRVIHQSRIERMEPMNARVTPEPSHLLAGEPFGLLCDVSERVIQIAQPVQVIDDLLIAQRPPGGRSQMGADPLHLFDETTLQHLLGADVDALVQLLAGQVQTDLH